MLQRLLKSNSAQVGWEGNPWTAQEQKVLETALKTYPVSDPERWDKVAACLPGRTKKDCVKRYKELAEIVRARKVALQQQKEKKPE
uniref:Myb-like domain-containing protein n=1 Tax=Romanomermis culicivorax TaxID=13658 RepID=A0A915HZK6_ROMCU